MSLNPESNKELHDASMPTFQMLDDAESLQAIATDGEAVTNPSDSGIVQGLQDSCVTTNLQILDNTKQKNDCSNEETVPNISPETQNKSKSNSEVTVSSASQPETPKAITRTIVIKKPNVSASAPSFSAPSPGGRKLDSPRKQLQLICENGRVVAAPQTVGRPSSVSGPAKKPASRRATTVAVVSQKGPEFVGGNAPTATVAIGTPSVVNVEEIVETSQSQDKVSAALESDNQSCQSEWVLDAADSTHAERSAGNGEQRMELNSVDDVEAAGTAGAAGSLDAVEAAQAVRRGDGAPRPRLVLSTTRPSSASAVLDAVESAAGTTAAVSHVVFEPNGRAVGALMPAAGAEGQRGEQQVVIAGQSAQQVVISGQETAQHVVLRAQQGQQMVLTGQHGTQHVVLMGEPGAERVIRTGQQREQQVVLANQQGDQQVMLTSQEGEQQVMLTLDRELLRTVGVGDDSDIVLQVDEGSDFVTLLVQRPSKEGKYEVSGDVGEVLELWERDSKGTDRLLGSVTETCLVDIRAVCEQCGCVISHHMVGLLIRDDGTEYGFRCRLCQCVQTDVDVMARHMDSHRSLADTQCRFCSKGLRTFKPQIERSFPCHACNEVFATKPEMIKHRAIHPPKHRFRCEVCDKTFPVKAQLEVHLRTHLGHKPYSCDMCPAAFTQPSHLINHRRTHTGERPYTCRQCGRSFVQQGHLRAHERTHTGERPYKCDICGRGFRQSGQLTAHKKLHEGDTPFKFRRRHGEPVLQDQITCRVCNKMFKLPKDLTRHKLIHEEGRFKCETCERTFKRADHLRRHKRQHEATSRKKRRRAAASQTERQDEGLTRLDRVIDAVLDDPIAHEDDDVPMRVEAGFQVKLEEIEDRQDDFSGSDEAVDDPEDAGEDPDDDEESDNRAHRSPVSRAPKDALWSQADDSDVRRWNRANHRTDRKPVGTDAYSRRSRLQTALCDDGVDDEMAMLTAALKERTSKGRQKKARAAGKGRLEQLEQTVKLEPDWEWDHGGGGDGHGEHEQDDWTEKNHRNAAGKRKRLRDVTKDPEDLVIPVWDDVNVSENVTTGVSRGPKIRVKGSTGPTPTLRTTSRSTAGNRAASVGVSLSRSSTRGGRR